MKPKCRVKPTDMPNRQNCSCRSESSDSKLKLRPRPAGGLGAVWIGKEEEKLVLDVIRRKEPFRYYGRDPNQPPPMAARLEAEFSQKMGVKYALAVTSGTAALEVALGALGIGPGDEVIIPVWSWISCFTSVVRMGALPVLAEIDHTFCLNPSEIGRLRTKRTKAVMVVHYQGVSADMKPILKAARHYGLAVIEDCAQSPGALYHGQRVGSMGTIGTYSFQYGKTITSGEGGMVVTHSPQLYERAVRMHDLGNMRPYHASKVKCTEKSFAGSQFRIGELHAAVALAQLRKLDRIRNRCRRLQRRLLKKLGKLPELEFRCIPDPKGDSGFEVYFCLKSAELAEEFRKRLNAWNINCGRMTGTHCHYGKPYCVSGLSHAPAASPFSDFKKWPARGYRQQDFPKTEALIHRFISLPLGLLYTLQDVDYIAAVVRRIYHEICK